MQPAPGPETLVVRSDTKRLRGRFRFVLVLHGVVVVLVLLLAGAVSGMEAVGAFVWVFLLLLVGEIVQIGIQCYYWGSRLTITEPLTVSSWGLELQSQQGTVRLPWASITGVTMRRTLGNQVLVIGIHPQAVPGQHGVEAEPGSWPRLRAKGIHIGEIGLVPGFDQIVPAIQHLSQGRVALH